MNRAWLARRRPALVRDLVRDYCTAHAALTAQMRRFEGDGTVSYAIIRALLGEALAKGVLWRLKDTAHHLFRAPTGDAGPAADARALTGELIDWCVGFAFHECIKLREDAYQRQHYANRLLRLEELGRAASGTDGESGPWPLAGLPRQTADSMERELRRILGVLDNGLSLLTRYLAGEAGNAPLARWLAVEEERAAGVFGPRWPEVLAALRGPGGESHYPLAAFDLVAAGRRDAAIALLRAHLDALGTGGLALLEELEAADRADTEAAPRAGAP